MMIIGCDLHTRYQQIAMLDTDTGEVTERRLEHETGEARALYDALVGPVRVGIEATGHTQWFEAMLREMGHELWVGDAAQVRAMVVRKQKTDTRDAVLFQRWMSCVRRNSRYPPLQKSSDATENEQNDHNTENQSHAAGRGITPLPAMRPSWQCTEKR